jgi:hypothetical protein
VGGVSLGALLPLAKDDDRDWSAVGEGGRIGSVARGSIQAAEVSLTGLSATGAVLSPDRGRICPRNATLSPAIKKTKTRPAIQRMDGATVIG